MSDEFMDPAARRSAKRVAAAGRSSAANRDAELARLADEYQGADPGEFATLARSRLFVALNIEYARKILNRR